MLGGAYFFLAPQQPALLVAFGLTTIVGKALCLHLSPRSGGCFGRRSGLLSIALDAVALIMFSSGCGGASAVPLGLSYVLTLGLLVHMAQLLNKPVLARLGQGASLSILLSPFAAILAGILRFVAEFMWDNPNIVSAGSFAWAAAVCLVMISASLATSQVLSLIAGLFQVRERPEPLLPEESD